MSWLAYSLAAAALWGILYAINGKLLESISVPGVLLVDSFGIVLLALCLGLKSNLLRHDWHVLAHNGTTLRLLIAGLLIAAAANFFITLSISTRNATMAAMIEIAYPLFTALFAWLLFSEVQVNAGTLVGTGLILAGVFCIYTLGKTI